MDKVDFSNASLLNPLLYKNVKQETKKTKTDNKSRTIFSDMMDSLSPRTGELGPLNKLAPSEEALTELMDAVHSAGSDLVDRPFQNEILRYKRAVRDFVNYIVENGYDIHRVEGNKRKVILRGEAEWKAKVYLQIQVIDRKLEELAAAILSGQTRQLQIVSKTDEIKGLLVDLTVTGNIKVRDE